MTNIEDRCYIFLTKSDGGGASTFWGGYIQLELKLTKFNGTYTGETIDCNNKSTIGSWKRRGQMAFHKFFK